MKLVATIQIVLVAVFLSVFLAYGFSEPANTSIGLSLGTPLNVGAITQSKSGGLGINAGEYTDGLIIDDFNDTEYFGIGTNNPAEKLHLIGNLELSGIIKPGGNPGNADNFLTNVNGQYMRWGNISWLNIQRVDLVSGGSCTQVWPDCPAGWTEYTEEISDAACPAEDGTHIGYGAVRICYQNF